MNRLIQSYPKVLYSVRAFTHALAYFNSCFNPFLYALLNRNFCIDLADVIPTWRSCCQQAGASNNMNGNRNTFRSSGPLLSQKFPPHYNDEEEENELSCQLIELPINNVNCHVELLRLDKNN